MKPYLLLLCCSLLLAVNGYGQKREIHKGNKESYVYSSHSEFTSGFSIQNIKNRGDSLKFLDFRKFFEVETENLRETMNKVFSPYKKELIAKQTRSFAPGISIYLQLSFTGEIKEVAVGYGGSTFLIPPTAMEELEKEIKKNVKVTLRQRRDIDTTQYDILRYFTPFWELE